MLKNPPATWETWVRSLGWEDPLEKGMATHSSILAWRIQSMGLERVDQAPFTFTLHRIPQHKWLLQTRKQRQGEGAQCSRGLPQASTSVPKAIAGAAWLQVAPGSVLTQCGMGPIGRAWLCSWKFLWAWSAPYPALEIPSASSSQDLSGSLREAFLML